MALIDDIDALQREVLETADLSPVRASRILVEFTALYYNVVAMLRETEHIYNAIEEAHVMAADGVVSRGKSKAKLTQQYKNHRLWRDTERTTLQQMQSLKKYMTTMAEEMRLAR